MKSRVRTNHASGTKKIRRFADGVSQAAKDAGLAIEYKLDARNGTLVVCADVSHLVENALDRVAYDMVGAWDSPLDCPRNPEVTGFRL